MTITPEWYAPPALEDQAGGNLETYAKLVEDVTSSIPGEAKLVVLMSSGKKYDEEQVIIGETADNGHSLSLTIVPRHSPVRAATLFPKGITAHELIQQLSG